MQAMNLFSTPDKHSFSRICEWIVLPARELLRSLCVFRALHAHESTVSVDEGAARRRRDVQGLTFQLRAAPGTELRQGSTVRFLLRPLLQWDLDAACTATCDPATPFACAAPWSRRALADATQVRRDEVRSRSSAKE